jgi:hypothetical protein
VVLTFECFFFSSQILQDSLFYSTQERYHLWSVSGCGRCLNESR